MPAKPLLLRTFAIPAILAAMLIPVAGCHQVDLHQSLRRNAPSAPDGSPMLLAVYQPWFGTPEHLDVGYSSLDRVVLQRQIEEAKNLGIGGFAVNWYGPRKEFMDRSYALMQTLAAENAFKVAIQYDESVDDPGNGTESVIADLQYAFDKYISGQGTPNASYLRYNGRPVILIFPKTNKTDWDRVRQVTNSWPDPPLLIYKDDDEHYAADFDGFYAWVEPGRGGWKSDGSNWGEGYLADFYNRMKTKYPDKIAVGAAWPGFNDRRASWTLNRFMNARCGKTFEDSLRLFRRYYNDQNPLPFLLIVTWNDYEEGTGIERGSGKCDTDGSIKNQAIRSFGPS
jgi:hypothetical protein